MRESQTSRRLSAIGPRDGDLSALPPLIRERIMKDGKKPAELFRKDLITAMKIPDTEHVDYASFWPIIEPWKPDYDKGVQIPVNPEAAPIIQVRTRKITTARDAILGPFTMPKKLINQSKRKELFDEAIHEYSDPDAKKRKLETRPRYNLDALDFTWLQLVNRQRAACGLTELSEEVLEKVVDDLETRCHNNLQANQFGIEYNEDTQCDVCGMLDSEEGNEMVFCDQCDLCVHQACYGIITVPAGSWLCVPCARGYSIKPQCALCPIEGGALKPDGDLDLWAHVLCALWIPEVTIGSPELMQPMQNLHKLPAWRKKLICVVCEKQWGVCIQCCWKDCNTAYHVGCARSSDFTMKMDVHEGPVGQDGLELKSYCKKHSKKPHKQAAFKNKHKQGQSSVEEQQQFYEFVDIKETAAHLRSVVDPLGADQIFNYWKLKRLDLKGKPLLSMKHEETLQRPIQIDDKLSNTIRNLVSLRQNLERARNLTYLVQRREKYRKQWVRAREEVTMAQMKAAEEHPESLRIIRTASRLDDIYDRSHSYEKSYGFPAGSVVASLMRAVARDSEQARAALEQSTSKTEDSGISPVGKSVPPNNQEPKRPYKHRKKLMFEVDENIPIDPDHKTQKESAKTQNNRFKKGHRRRVETGSPMPVYSSNRPKVYSPTHRHLRVGRRRGGPFKRAMIPDLHLIYSPDLSKPNDKPAAMSAPSEQISDSRRTTRNTKLMAVPEIVSDIDSEISPEILTGQEYIDKTNGTRSRVSKADKQSTPSTSESQDRTPRLRMSSIRLRSEFEAPKDNLPGPSGVIAIDRPKSSPSKNSPCKTVEVVEKPRRSFRFNSPLKMSSSLLPASEAIVNPTVSSQIRSANIEVETLELPSNLYGDNSRADAVSISTETSITSFGMLNLRAESEQKTPEVPERSLRRKPRSVSPQKRKTGSAANELSSQRVPETVLERTRVSPDRKAAASLRKFKGIDLETSPQEGTEACFRKKVGGVAHQKPAISSPKTLPKSPEKTARLSSQKKVAALSPEERKTPDQKKSETSPFEEVRALTHKETRSSNLRKSFASPKKSGSTTTWAEKQQVPTLEKAQNPSSLGTRTRISPRKKASKQNSALEFDQKEAPEKTKNYQASLGDSTDKDSRQKERVDLEALSSGAKARTAKSVGVPRKKERTVTSSGKTEESPCLLEVSPKKKETISPVKREKTSPGRVISPRKKEEASKEAKISMAKKGKASTEVENSTETSPSKKLATGTPTSRKKAIRDVNVDSLDSSSPKKRNTPTLGVSSPPKRRNMCAVAGSPSKSKSSAPSRVSSTLSKTRSACSLNISESLETERVSPSRNNREIDSTARSKANPEPILEGSSTKLRNQEPEKPLLAENNRTLRKRAADVHADEISLGQEAMQVKKLSENQVQPTQKRVRRN